MATMRKRDTFDRIRPWLGDESTWRIPGSSDAYSTAALRDILHSLERLARSYDRIQERWCSEEMSDETTVALGRREALLEQRIRTTVGTLPAPLIDGRSGTWAVLFEGDPRGYTVKLVPISPSDEDPGKASRESSRHVGVWHE